MGRIYNLQRAVKIAELQVEIRTLDLPDTKQK
jgi:hypothetical protein